MSRTQTCHSTRSHVSVRCVAAASLVILAACKHTSTPTPVSRNTPPQRVPAVAPDSVPHALFDSLGLVQGPSGRGVQAVRGIVAITFKENATQKEKQATIDAINGTVVGGFNRVPISEYFVRIRGLGWDDIQSALGIVRSQPQVHSAFPMMHDSAAGTQRHPPA